MDTKRFALAALLIGLSGIALQAVQIATYDKYLSTEWSHATSRWNHLAFFTVITNFIIDVWLIVIAFSVFFKLKKLHVFFTSPSVHGAVVLYILAVSVIYCGLLFWFIGPYSQKLWWGNVIDMWNHFAMPLFMVLVFWFTKHSKPIRLRHLWFWQIFPFVYFLFSLIRGLITEWYPYPFFKPSWIAFPIGIVMVTAVFVGLGYALIRLHNRKIISSS